MACGPAAARAADSSPLTRHTREMAAAERLRVPGPLSPGAARVGGVRARAPARCAWRTQCHPFPWPFSASPKARDKAHEPRAAARASLIREKTGTLPPAPPHGLPALRQHARTAPGARALWRTAPGRFATPRVLGKALLSYLAPVLTLQANSAENIPQSHFTPPSESVASELSEIRGFEQDQKSRRAAPNALPVGGCPDRCPPSVALESERGCRNHGRAGRGAGNRVDI